MLLAVGFGQPQSREGATSFEVASIRAYPDGTTPSTSLPRGCAGGPGTATPGRFACTGITLPMLITQAFRVRTYQLVMKDYGLHFFDIAADVPDGTSEEQLAIMLQNLLVERFHLDYHWQQQQGGIYRLMIATRGAKLSRSSHRTGEAAERETGSLAGSYRGARGPNGCPILGVTGTVSPTVILGPKLCAEGAGASMDDLVKFLESVVRGPVEDATGLEGRYDISIGFADESKSRGMPELPSEAKEAFAQFGSDATIFGALEQQLGLKLEKQTGNIRVFVVDRVEIVPTAN